MKQFFVCVDTTGRPAITTKPVFDVVGVYDTLEAATDAAADILASLTANAAATPQN